MHTQEVEITKSDRRWSMHTMQQWKGASHPSHTYSPANTLAWSIFHAVDWAASNDTKIIRLDVNGKPCPRDKIEKAIKKHARGYKSAYRRRLLAVCVRGGTK